MTAQPKKARARRSDPRVSIAIGSWTDKEYTGLIFPKGVKTDERLRVYATRFEHVEVNAGYHAIQPTERVAKWVEQTPENFRFDFKLHRAFSERPRESAQNEAFMGRLIGSARPLIASGKLSSFFVVMPPSFEPKRRKLEELEVLAEKLQPHPLAVELRHRGWVDGAQRERTLEFFRARKLVWIAVDMPRLAGSTIMPPIDEVTNPRLAYLRLHGRRDDWPALKSAEERHTYEYRSAELDEIAARIRKLARKAERVHVVANNHAQDLAPKTALALQKLLGIERARRK